MLAPLDDARLRHFEAYVARLRPVFHRADQALRFRAYLRGLVEPTERKNVEAIALAAGRSMMVEADLPQALQHFVSHSPWGSGRLFAAVLRESRGRRDDPHAVWVVRDAAFAKKGQHSVGVLRQLARDRGRKINCQVAVTVAQVGPRGFFPLLARLYLPAGWLKDNPEAAGRGVPEEHRQFAPKGEIALDLLDELVGAGEARRPLALESGYSGDAAFAAGLRERDLGVAENDERADRQADRGMDWLKAVLGLDHFEGRTWHGWHHHASLVFAAYDLLAAEGGSPDAPPFCSPRR